MKSVRTPLVVTAFTGLLLTLAGCSTSHVRARGIAAVDESLIEKFVDSLASRSSLGSQEAVEDTLTQVVNDNSSKLSLSKIDSLDEIGSMSDADQTRIINALAALPELSEKLALDSEALDVARGEALAAQSADDQIATESVPNLQKPAASAGADADAAASDSVSSAASDAAGTQSFAKLLARSPELKDDVALMEKEETDIEQKVPGTQVLVKGCDSLQDTESVENLATVIAGVDRDVASGQAGNNPGVAKSLENNMEYVLGEDQKTAHDGICELSSPSSCGVFSPKMCN